MSNLGNLSFKVLGDLSQFNRDIANVQKKLNQSTKGLQTVARGMTTVGDSMVKGITLPIIAMGAALLKIGNDFDDAYDKIRVGTGKTGKELEGLKADFKEVAKVAPSSFQDISTAITEVNKRLGLTGKPLQDLSTQILNLSRITKTDLNSNIQNVTRTFGDWSISTDKQSKALDYMYKVSQNTGIGVDRLGTLIVQYGAPTRQLGFDFETAAAMLGKFEQEGVNTELVMGSLRIALTRMAKEGIEDPAEALQIMIQRIKDAGTAGEANTLALEMFGARAGPDMAAAIREGRLDLDDFLKKLKDSPETINAAAKATEDFKEKLILLRNNVSLALEPLATKIFDAIGRGVDKVTPKVEELAKWFGNLSPTMQDNFIKWGLIAAIIPVVISGLGRALTAAIKFRNAILLLNASLHISAGYIGAIGAALLATGAYYTKLTQETIKAKEVTESNWEALLIAGHKMWGMELPAEIQKTIDTTKESTEATEEQIPTIDKAKQSVDEYKQSLIDEGNTATEVTKKTNAYAETLGYVADEQGELEEATDDTTEAIDDQAEAVDKLRSSFNKLLDIIFGGITTFNDFQEAEIAVKEAQEKLNQLIKEGKQGTDEYIKAENNLDDANIALIKSSFELSTSTEATTKQQEEARKKAIELGLQYVATGDMSIEKFIEMATEFGLSSVGIILKAKEMGIELDEATRMRIINIDPGNTFKTTQEIVDELMRIQSKTVDINVNYNRRYFTYGSEFGVPGGSLGGIFTGREFLRPMVSAIEGMMIPKFDSGGVLALLHPPEIVLNAKEAMQLVWNMANKPVDTKTISEQINKNEVTLHIPINVDGRVLYDIWEKYDLREDARKVK